MTSKMRDRHDLPEPPPHRSGATTTVKDDERVHRQPHERDESSDSQQGEPTEVMRQAHDDIERGLSDTSRGEAADLTYERNLRTHRRGVPKSTKP